MTAKKRQLLIESCEFVSKVKLPKELKESVKLSKGKADTLIVRNIPSTILNRKNLNQRIYSTQVVQAALDEAKPLIEMKQLLSQSDEHPDSNYVAPSHASHVIIGAYIKPNVEIVVDGHKERQDVLFTDWEVLNTQEGKNLRALLEAECSIGVSIRGMGDLEGNQVVDYSFSGVDCVGQPSSSSYTRMPVSESVQVELVDREPMKEGFTVSTSSTNVVSDLDKAAVIQSQLDNATYGTVQKTSTKLDSEIDPKTGATTSITTLEADTEDEVETLDQALVMAKNAILNGLVDVDSVTIEKIKEEEPTDKKKESAPEYVPEDTLNEEEKDPTYLALKKTGYYSYDDPAKYMEFIKTNSDKLGKYKSLPEAEEIYGKYVNGEMSKELACHELEAFVSAVQMNTPFELSDSAKAAVKEAKEKDPKEGKQFVLKTPNGYVSMEGNALTFKEDPKLALHFIVGKENTGLVHLSEVEKILDTMGVYDVKKYYKRDLSDISATADEEEAPVEEKAVNNAEPVVVDNAQNAMLTEDDKNPYEAVVKTQSGSGSAKTETIPVSGRDQSAILAEIGNLWRQKSENGKDSLIVELHDNTNGTVFTYNPANNTLDPVNVQESLNDDDAIEQDDNTLKMTLNPDDEDPIEVEKEFDTKAQATVAKAGIEQGKIDGGVMLNEEEIQPGWYVGVDGIGIIGPFESKKEAMRGLENEPNISVEYIGNEQPQMENINEAEPVEKVVRVEFKPAKEIKDGYDLDFVCDTPEVTEELTVALNDMQKTPVMHDDKLGAELRTVPDEEVEGIIMGLQNGNKFRLVWKEAAENMHEILFTGKPEASDPVVEEPLQDSENDLNLKPATDTVKVVLTDVDWDVDSLANNSGDDLEGAINLLPNEIVVEVDANKLTDMTTAKQIILDTANAQSQYKINDATIADIQ